MLAGKRAVEIVGFFRRVQQRRAETYQMFDSGLASLLEEEEELEGYPPLCAAVTATFASLSAQCVAAKEALEELPSTSLPGADPEAGAEPSSVDVPAPTPTPPPLPPPAAPPAAEDSPGGLILRIQALESEKLTVKAAMHLDTIRQAQLERALRGVPEEEQAKVATPMRLLSESLDSLRTNHAGLVEQINELLEELRYVEFDE